MTVSTSLNKFANSEVEVRRVGDVNAPVGSGATPTLQFSCAVELLRVVRSDDVMTLKKLSISIKIHVVTLLLSLNNLFPNCRPNQSTAVVVS